MTLHLRLMVAIFAVAIPSAASADAIVTYSGTVYSESFDSSVSPASNAYVIAGTFAPSFDPSDYKCTYGLDEVCNMGDNGFNLAVGDGNIFPIGSGTLTDANGVFNGSGVTSAAAGTPIYLFAFGGPDSDGGIQNVAFVSSTDPSFLAPASEGSATLDASLANLSILGRADSNGLYLSIGLPVPEPTSAALGLLCVSALLNTRLRSRRANT